VGCQALRERENAASNLMIHVAEDVQVWRHLAHATRSGCEPGSCGQAARPGSGELELPGTSTDCRKPFNPRARLIRAGRAIVGSNL